MIEKLDIKDYENKEQLVWVGVINKLNALIDTVNGILDYAPLEMAMKAEPDNESRQENVPAPITIIDVFNEMGRLYADLWNKMEDIHYDLKTKGGDNE